MPEEDPVSTTVPQFSVIIAVYNDWIRLKDCLESLGQQANSPGFEVIVVDDGSSETAPRFIQQWASQYLVTIVRQSHAGIPTARNRGVQIAKGPILVFADADCRFQTECLAALRSAVANSPHGCFQLHLVGNRATLVGKSEELRLITLQNHMLQPNGCVRYLNTAGFAIRRAEVDVGNRLFDPTVPRGEDTLLLVNLMQKGELPFFVTEAIVQHITPLSVIQCLRKDIRSAYLEGRAYDIIVSKGVHIRVKHRERFQMLLDMWRASATPTIGRAAWFVLVTRQLLQRITSLACWCLRIRPAPPV